MLNQMCLVGRLLENPTITKDEDKSFSTIKLICQRSYKNIMGEYDIDIIPIRLWNAIATNTVEYCHKGDLVGIKGRVETIENEIVIIADKITFLASKGSNNEL